MSARVSSANLVKFNYEGEKRLLFKHAPVNPRNEAGKMGIRVHTGISAIARDTVTLPISFQDGQASEIALNRKSAIRYVNAVNEGRGAAPLPMNANAGAIIPMMTAIMRAGEQKQIDTTLNPPNVSNAPLRKTIDKVKGVFWNAFWNITTYTLGLFVIRHKVLQTSEKDYEEAGNARARASFWKAMGDTPRYQEHINTHGGIPRTWDAVPMTNKKYITEAGDPRSAYVGGQYPRTGIINTSSGTSGKPTQWVRGTEEQAITKRLLSFAKSLEMRGESFVFINTFALGPWATGMTVASVIEELPNCRSFNPGMDMKNILDTLKGNPPAHHPGYRYVIAGYPPMIEAVVERIRSDNQKIQNGEMEGQIIDLDSYHLEAVVGGQGISPVMRKNMLGLNAAGEKDKPGIARAASSYGASDLDVNIGYQTNFEVELEEICSTRPDIAHEIYGDMHVPSFFHYDPLYYVVEGVEPPLAPGQAAPARVPGQPKEVTKQLAFTCSRSDRCSPRIRYNLEDVGITLRVQDVLAVLKKHGIQMRNKPNTNLPLLLVWGRDSSINIGGAKVHESNLNTIKNELPELQGKVASYAFNIDTQSGRERYEFMFEMNPGQQAPVEGSEEHAALSGAIVQRMRVINSEFNQVMHQPNADTLRPTIKFFNAGQSVMTTKKSASGKFKYIFRNMA